MLPNGVSQVYEYDALNRLTNVAVNRLVTPMESYAYTLGPSGHRLVVQEGNGRRVTYQYDNLYRLTRETRYVVDDAPSPDGFGRTGRNPTGYSQVLAELDETNGVLVTYTVGLDVIAQTRVIGTNEATHFYGYDRHGNTRFLTDTNGYLTDRWDYDAYGNIIARSGTTPNDLLYCGEYRDPDLGLYFLRARWMETGRGRFWTMDVWEGWPCTPISLHKYLYANANPVTFADPNGEWTLTEVTVTASTISLLAGIAAPYILHKKDPSLSPSECWGKCMQDSGMTIAMIGVGLGLPATSLPIRRLFRTIGPNRYTTLLSVIDHAYFVLTGGGSLGLRAAGRFFNPIATPLFYSDLSYLGGAAISCSVR